MENINRIISLLWEEYRYMPDASISEKIHILNTISKHTKMLEDMKLERVNRLGQY